MSTPQICPYLDTISRSSLDFDQQRSCSQTLTETSIYACLVCGKFFQGRGQNTPAYTHSLETGHAVYCTLTSPSGEPSFEIKFYCLPDSYEIINEVSLRDIAAAVNPIYTPTQVASLDSNLQLKRDVFSNKYLPGYVGVNNLKKTDYITVVLIALSHVKPLRDYFLLGKEGGSKSTIVSRYGEFVRKVWSGKRFRSSVDPEDLVQQISVVSSNRFTIGTQGNGSEFFVWFVNELHKGLIEGEGKEEDNNEKKKRAKRGRESSVVTKCFQGIVNIQTITHKKKVKSIKSLDDTVLSDSDNEDDVVSMKPPSTDLKFNETTSDSPFLQLTLDIPQKPLFKDDDKGGLIIPQEPLQNVLTKFDGSTFIDVLNKGMLEKKRYRIKKLPTYLVLHLGRFTKNNFYVEKNPTIVTFPVTDLDLTDYVYPDLDSKKKETSLPPTEEEIRGMDVKSLKSLLKKHDRLYLADGVIERAELVDIVIDFLSTTLRLLLENKYNLIANICHDTPAEVGKEGKRNPLEEGSYRCHVSHLASKQWFEIEDLVVKETMPQLIGMSESLILIFEKKV